MSLGERMREMRKMLRLSQEELAFRLGTNRVSISQWENNRVTPDADSLIKTAAEQASAFCWAKRMTPRCLFVRVTTTVPAPPSQRKSSRPRRRIDVVLKRICFLICLTISTGPARRRS